MQICLQLKSPSLPCTEENAQTMRPMMQWVDDATHASISRKQHYSHTQTNSLQGDNTRLQFCMQFRYALYHQHNTLQRCCSAQLVGRPFIALICFVHIESCWLALWVKGAICWRNTAHTGLAGIIHYVLQRWPNGSKRYRDGTTWICFSRLRAKRILFGVNCVLSKT